MDGHPQNYILRFPFVNKLRKHPLASRDITGWKELSSKCMVPDPLGAGHHGISSQFRKMAD